MSAKIKLQYPVTVDGVEYAELNMRRCKVRDRRLAGKKQTDDDREMALFTILCEVSPEVIEELDSADYAQIVEAFKGFFASATTA